MNDDYDSPWKDALTRYFPEFMAFYFPEAYAQIDWTVRHAFLEQELAQVVRDGELGCRQRNWSKQDVIDLFAVIDWMMWVPPPLQRQLLDNIRELETERAMPYMNPFQKLGLEEGLQQGRQQGRQEGSQALCDLLEIQLEQRFGELPQPVRDRLRRAGPDDLKAWGTAILNAPSLERVFSPR